MVDNIGIVYDGRCAIPPINRCQKGPLLAKTLAKLPETVCILRLSAIGDVCNAQAAIMALKNAAPDTRLTWIIGKTEASLVGDTPGIEFIIFDKSRGLAAYRDLKRQLRGRRFDALLMMHASMRANLASRMIRADRRIGFDKARAKDFQFLFSNERIDARQCQHVLDGFLQFVEQLGVSNPRPNWAIVNSDESTMTQYIDRTDSRPVVLISPCTSQRSRNFRNWSAANYAAICDYVVWKFKARVFLTGGGSELEQEYSDEISARCAEAPLSLIGKTGLKELYALIKAADLLICPDSGPLHMAVAAGTPVVGLYASSNPARTGPYRSRELVANSYAEAARKYLDKDVAELAWGERIRDPNVMSQISPEQVVAKIDQAFAASKS